jgi:phosphatidylserine/phosphatidylglycerophosphate/cardiolipin synthase-like enzyme
MFRSVSVFLLFFSLAFFQTQPVFGSEIESYYGPEEHLQDRMISLYQTAEKSIYISCFTITSWPIVKTLIKAKKKGVEVKVITDSGELENKNTRNAVKALLNAGIPVKINRHEGLMHIKQAVIDDSVNTSGSFNQTWSAKNLNDERLDIISDRANSHKAKEKFLSMWNDQVRFKELKEDF